MIKFYSLLSAMLLLLSSTACKHGVKQQEDQVYSRHLQRQVSLTIINTPIPDDKQTLNLLLLNDGQDMEKFRIKQIVDSLFKNKLIEPLLIVGIHAGDRMREYGVAGIPDFQNRGDRADKYSAFVTDELYPFIKKRAGVRKFNSVVIAGCSLGGLSAMDIAWNNADRFDKVGVFSGSFWWRDKDTQDPQYSDDKDRIMQNMVRSSRKKPHLKYWFYAGGKEEEGDRDKDGIIDVMDDTKDLISIILKKNVCTPDDIVMTEDASGQHDYPFWSRQLPVFLLWAFGK